MSRWYVYALTDRPVRPTRAARRVVESVKAGNFYAAVARMNALPTVSESTLAEQHRTVVRLAGGVQAILPMRFGALVDADQLERFVVANRHVLSDAFDLVRGREQMTLRMFGLPPKRRHATREAEPATGTEYLQSRRNAARPVPLPEAAAFLCRSVRPLVAAERTAAGEGAVRATVWHLIERGKSEAYRAAIAGAAPGVSRRFQVAVSGPWPPFAFAPELVP